MWYILTQIQSNESLYRHLESKTQKQVPLPSTLTVSENTKTLKIAAFTASLNLINGRNSSYHEKKNPTEEHKCLLPLFGQKLK